MSNICELNCRQIKDTWYCQSKNYPTIYSQCPCRECLIVRTCQVPCKERLELKDILVRYTKDIFYRKLVK